MPDESRTPRSRIVGPLSRRERGRGEGQDHPDLDARRSTPTPPGTAHLSRDERRQEGRDDHSGDSTLGPPPQESPAVKKRRPDPTPTQRALGLLTRREHSRKELTRKLQAKGVAREDAAQAIGRLAEAGWQDDARFAEMLARTRANAGHGPLRIRADLSTHGLDADAIRTALDAVEAEVDWGASARDLVRRRIGPLADLRQRRKAADLLIRRGFDADTVRAATRVEPDDEA